MEPNWALSRKREKLARRARIVQTIRAFFIDHDFLEVETPHLVPANAPEACIDAVPAGEGYLHTSPELCMKRLLAAGYPRLFQLCRCWRQGERGSRHLPEYTMLEWYQADTDYHALMTDCENLLHSLLPEETLTWQGSRVDLSLPWERLTVRQAFERYASISLEDALAEDRFDEVIALEIEPRLGAGKPTFITEYPVEAAALARKKPGDPSVAERFELYILGMELANAFSELTDPAEQRSRFEGTCHHARCRGHRPWRRPPRHAADRLENDRRGRGLYAGRPLTYPTNTILPIQDPPVGRFETFLTQDQNPHNRQFTD